MDWKKVVGLVGVIAGSVFLYLGGTSESAVAELVGGAFILVGIIANLLKPKEEPKKE